jgi:thymidylate synthase (FAD)
MDVLDKGIIGLDEWMGSDLKVARAAWVSYGKQDSDRPITGVINYMMKHRHGTPFEHVVFSWYVKAPIFVAREWMRHRIGSFNEISGRYVKFEPEFYIPDQIRVKGDTNKQGSVLPDEDWAYDRLEWVDVNDFNKQMIEDLTSTYETVYDNYLGLLDSGVANEQARMVLPVGLYTQYFWTVNLRALLNFLSLRNADNAQWEIRQYAIAIEEQLKELVPITYEAWVDNGRTAP